MSLQCGLPPGRKLPDLRDGDRYGGRTFEGIAARVARRILAMAADIRHNHTTGAPVLRSLIAYDH
ncbi:hypothetical protein J2S55_008717 [Streptosporangium brasiliense]|uniref:Uncharacterized protein n=1 Tax=Streptosporangium brasiliense TaxID=47480 RepID=A0ABT9RKW3_9ACTN|nr:hypothetical protein [Streptosporangium brasiliense]